MDLRIITDRDKKNYNKLVTHVIQSWEWGEARKSLGTPVLRYGLYQDNKLQQVFQLTLHQIPFTNQYVGYLPKGPIPDQNLAKALKKIGKENNCAFIKVEPNIEVTGNRPSALRLRLEELQATGNLLKSPKPLFTKYNFVLDLIQSEEEILKNMHSKTRYNIKVAQKHSVKVEERIDDEAFAIFLKLYFETTKRQNYHGHNEYYHQKIWQTLRKDNMARLLISYYDKKPVTAWMLLNFKDTLYYPYGGSSLEHREVMANNLVAWEAIKLGKKLKLKKFDMWGAANNPNPNKDDPYYGFHHFKQGYGAKLVEYIGTYDLVLSLPIYRFFNIIDKLTPLKVFILKWISH